MFNKNNFCHVASNNRNEKKAGIFVYKTTDDLATVSTSGYFNDKIVDINLHDLIIHEWHDPADRTKVEKNVLCVTERTLDNVGTAVIKSKWEADVEEIIEHLSDTYVLKTGDTMTGPLNIIDENGTDGALITLRNGTNDTRTWRISASSSGPDLQFTYLASGITRGYAFIGNGIIPLTHNFTALGNNNHHWTKAYVNALNNGYDIAVPVTAEADTLALKSQVDLAANSGTQLRDKGVWYAKMDAATTPPASAGVEGRNYADFTQVDQDNNPIIVIYTYTSGAWTQTETITPPAAYNGYLPITSKFWDIQEQAGQQGGQVLWSHTAKTFTPYPRIISTDSIAITNSTFSNGTLTNVITTMPGSPVAKTVTNVQYVQEYQNKQDIKELVADTTTITLEKGKTIYMVELTNDATITVDASGVGISGSAQTFEIHVKCGATVPVITWNGINKWLVGSIITPTEVNATSIFVVRVQQGASELSPTVVANYGGAY